MCSRQHSARTVALWARGWEKGVLIVGPFPTPSAAFKGGAGGTPRICTTADKRPTADHLSENCHRDVGNPGWDGTCYLICFYFVCLYYSVSLCTSCLGHGGISPMGPVCVCTCGGLGEQTGRSEGGQKVMAQPPRSPAWLPLIPSTNFY